MSDLLVSYYGDDFTGSTDVMESLTSSGIPTVLFLGVPQPDMLQRFADCRAVGIAGTSRSETPEWMQQNLAPALRWLQDLDAAICHYKVCSTFDSAPGIGSIGKAIEIGRACFAQPLVPVVVGAPQLRRYTAFGHLFAAYQGQVFRIDRHPVMSRHPVTPMDEADLAIHLGKQTRLAVSVADLTVLRAADADARIDECAGRGAGILLLDVDSPETQAAAGRQLRRLQAPMEPPGMPRMQQPLATPTGSQRARQWQREVPRHAVRPGCRPLPWLPDPATCGSHAAGPTRPTPAHRRT